jgi:hypothetical protein
MPVALETAMVIMTVPVSFQVFNQNTTILNPLSPNMKANASSVFLFWLVEAFGPLDRRDSLRGARAHAKPTGLLPIIRATPWSPHQKQKSSVTT